MATLATGLPATALAGLDFHQLDFIEKFPLLFLRFPLSRALPSAMSAVSGFVPV